MSKAMTLIRDMGSGSLLSMEIDLYLLAEREALIHKWIESERAGRDLGDEALKNWVVHHWDGYLRARWLEHLEGKAHWPELDRGNYGFFQRRFDDKARQLLDLILVRLKAGRENLDLIIWAQDCGLPCNEVIDILTSIDINSRRLKHRFVTIKHLSVA